MSKVVELKEYTLDRAFRRGLPRWQTHFKEDLKRQTRLIDLSDQTLLTLANLQGSSSFILQDLIMGFHGYGTGVKFQYLDAKSKMEVLDIYFYIADQIRWECMRRLGWVEGFAGEEYSVAELIFNYKDIKSTFSPRYPQLTESHPNYEEFIKNRQFEGEAIVRRLIPVALAFLEKKVRE
ncbi:MAG: hypothetical protein JRG97_14785 [Deltaproteobacteria bacterium]|nr:hypothetical protein [Deltaproteobacteria bacterium]MBW2053138.1 hypothetical protein [Deltaproteobacteria bacterium]MBW2142307.1 hypothetical protein [Deltaproteobacteria bacterium]MBW2324312.1 hypothetical protein [Deltaproteobacteria bacterium]